MTAERCERCDREECDVMAKQAAAQKAPVPTAATKYRAFCVARDACDAHAIDWRTRARDEAQREHPTHRHDECPSRAPGRCGLCDDNVSDPRDAEIARLRATCAARAEIIDGLKEMNASLVAEVARLRAALERFGQHVAPCAAGGSLSASFMRAAAGHELPCTCGLAAALTVQP
jgi:hypothetical protein